MELLVKICTQCKIEKDINLFCKRTDRIDKYRSSCKECDLKSRKTISREISVLNKKCSKCELILSADSFNARKSATTGLTSFCKSCSLNKKRLFYSAEENRIKRRMYNKKRRIENPSIHLVQLAKTRAKQKNKECNITCHDIKVPNLCPILGLKIEASTNDIYNSPSIDCIDPNKGYTIDNVICISFKANQIKNSASLHEMSLIFKNYFELNTMDNSIVNDLHIKKIIKRSKQRAKNKNLDFDLDKNSLILPKTCPLLNILIDYDSKQYNENTPSIDRIDNSKGYTKDNVRIISYRANSLKNVSTFEEYSKIYLYYLAKSH